MKDPFFAGTVILILEHTEAGAIGFIVNRELETNINTILNKMDLKKGIEPNRPALWGGPVGEGSCFLLSSSIQQHAPTNKEKELLEALLEANTYFEMIIGYSGWGPEQLEGEIETGSWFFTDMSTEEMLDIPLKDRYTKALDSLGVAHTQLWIPPIQT